MFNPSQFPPYQPTSDGAGPTSTDDGNKTAKGKPANKQEDTSVSSALRLPGRRSPSAFESSLRARYSNRGDQGDASGHGISYPEDINAYNAAAMDWFLRGRKDDARTYIEPNRTTRSGGKASWGCERRAAAFQARTIDFSNANDVAAVCFNLLQARRSATANGFGAAMEAFVALAFLSLLAMYKETDLQKPLAAAVVGAGVVAAMAVPPHIGVSRQYFVVHKECQEYLAGRFGQEFVEKIESMELDDKGLNDLIGLLSSTDPEIKTLKLQKQLDKLKGRSTEYKLTQLRKNVYDNLYPELLKLDPKESQES